MSAPHLRRRYRTSGSRRGLLYFFAFLGTAALYVGQRIYTDRLQVELGRAEESMGQRQATRDGLRAERDRLTSYASIVPRAEALGLKPADIGQLARVPLSAPILPYSAVSAPAGFGNTFVRVWHWLDGPAVQTQAAQAAP